MPRASPSLSSSSRSSVTPPPQVTEKKKKKISKEKKTLDEGQQAHGKSEGVNPNWDYAPPPGAVLIEKEDVDGGYFDWDKINNDEDLELWLIRVPEGVKPKYLENLTVDIPSSSTSACIGTLKRKHTAFDIWSIGDGQDSLPICGEEMKNLSCILPRTSKKGKLYPTPKPIARRIVISAQPVSATPPSDSQSTSAYKNPPRQSYPKEILKHRFKPYGSDLNKTDNATPMDVDVEEQQPSASPKKKRAKHHDAIIVEEEMSTVAEPEAEVVKKTKGKKRKGEPTDTADTPTKKTKKTKVA